MNHEIDNDNTTAEHQEVTKPGDSAKSVNMSSKSSLKMTRRRTVFIIGIISLIVVALLCGVLYILHTITEKPSTQDQGLASATHFPSTKNLVDQSIIGAKGSEMEVSSASGSGGFTKDGYTVYGFPTYKLSGKKFGTLPLKGSGAGFSGDSVATEKTYKHFIDFFSTNKFQPIEAYANKSCSYDVSVIPMQCSVYESSSTICSVFNVDATGTQFAQHVAGIGCAEKADYTLAAEAIEPLYVAFNEGKDGPKDDLMFAVPSGTVGADGYRNTTVEVEDVNSSDNNTRYFTAMYYQRSDDKKWTYFAKFTDGNLIHCSDFKDAAKKVYAGSQCYDNNLQKNSVVQ